MTTSKYQGELEIDYARGVIYFHRTDTGTTLLRISRLGMIPVESSFIDITRGSNDAIASVVMVKPVAKKTEEETKEEKKKDLHDDFVAGKVKQIDVD